MSAPYALIPIHLDVLFCASHQPTAEPRINFDRLPYFDGQLDRNTAVPYLGEEIQSIPFRNDQVGLKKGLHLHWHLPEALTRSQAQPMLYFREMKKALPEEEAAKVWDWLTKKEWIYPLIDGKLAGILIDPPQFRAALPEAAKELRSLEKIRELFLPRNTQFPPVPNRWIIVKRREGAPAPEKVVVLESDFLHPFHEGNPHDSTPFPVGYEKPRPGAPDQAPTNPPFRYLGGKTYTLDEWKTTPANGEYLEDPLTVLGYGEPTFAAFYPNCRGVFGWHDPDVQAGDNDLIYEIIGFYGEPEWDFLRIFLRDFARRMEYRLPPGRNDSLDVFEWLEKETARHLNLEGLSQHLPRKERDRIGKDIEDYRNHLAKLSDPALLLGPLGEKRMFLRSLAHSRGRLRELLDQHLPVQSLLYGKIVYRKAAKPAAESSNEVEIAIGNTGTEALSAYLNHKLSIEQDGPPIIEEFLESLQFNSQLEHLKSDVLERFKELRHARGFVNELGGTRWTVRALDGQNEGETEGAATLLPDRLAEALHRIGALQRELDRLEWQLTSAKTQTYADWTKYMVCQYPPNVWEEDYPDIDQVRHLIASTGLREIERLQIEADQTRADLAEEMEAFRTELFHLQKIHPSEIADIPGFVEALGGDFKKITRKIDPSEAARDPAVLASLVDNLNRLLEEKALFDRDRIDPALLSQEAVDLLRRGRENWKEGEVIRFNRIVLERMAPQLAPKPLLVLQPLGESRFWRPTNPVVLLAGDGMKAHPRHGMNEVLACRILTADLERRQLSMQTLINISREAEQLLDPQKKPYAFLGAVQNGKPSHPLFLDWLVDYYPTGSHEDQEVQIKGYARNYITSHYDLHPNEPYLTRHPANVGEGAHSYWGSAILTAQAGKQLDQEILEFIKREVEFWVQEVKEKGIEDHSNFGLLLNTEGTAELSAGDLVERFFALVEKDFDTFFVRILQYSADPLLLAFYAKEPSFKGKPDDWYLQRNNRETFFHAFFRAFPPQTFDKATPTTHYQSWYFLMALFAYERLHHTSYMSQALDGFNQALLMYKTGFQLDIADPIGYPEYQAFTEKVNGAIGTFNHASVLPNNPFYPIRSGALKLGKLRIVDTFGIKKEVEVIRRRGGEELPLNRLYSTDTIAAETLRGETYHDIQLRPRFVQPARINFRWLSSVDDALEMTDHPVSSPIFGWLLLNEIDESLMIYDQMGKALGYIDKEGRWRVFPGHSGPVLPAGIANDHLRRLVVWICGKAVATKDDPQPFMDHFFERLEQSIDNIEAADSDHYEGTSLLMSHPLALVRASVQVELKGETVKHQGWEPLKRELKQVVDEEKVQRETLGFENVDIPLRLGERHKLNDGLVAFWVDDENGYRGDTYFSPLDPQVLTMQARPSDQIDDRDGLHLSMLMDPRGNIHATTGFFPVKTLELPPALYKDILRSIEVVFLAAPVLGPQGLVNISLPQEEGFDWAWIERTPKSWREISTVGYLSRKAFLETFGKEAVATWDALIANGSLRPVDEEEAIIALQNGAKPLQELFPNDHAALEHFFRSRLIGPFQQIARFEGQQEVREGWLKLRPTNGETK